MPLSPTEPQTSIVDVPFADGPDSPLLLGHADVVELVTMGDAVAALERSCKDAHEGNVIMGERQNLRFPGGWIRLMPAANSGSGIFGYKEFHLVAAPDGTPTAHVRYTVHLFDLGDGRHLASIDANHLTLLRTGAASAVGTHRLARDQASEVAVIGSGSEARVQLEALQSVRDIRGARVYSPTLAKRVAFADEMSVRLSIDVVPVSTASEAVTGADVVVAATLTEGVPALLGEWLQPGQHVTSIGSTMPSQRELDPEVWRRADLVVVDTLTLMEESGDALAAAEVGAVDLGRVRELNELVATGGRGRTSAEQITLYKSVGTSLQDLAVAELAYRRAVSAGAGERIADVNSVKTVIPN